MSLGAELGILVALVLVNGLLAGAEIAVVALRRSRLDELVERGSRSAKLLGRMRAQPERFFATVQIGITVIGVTAGAFGGARFGADLAKVLARWEPLAPYADPVAFAVVVVLVTYLSLVLGELVPKSLALRSSERYALLVARPLAALQLAARPAVWLLTTSSNAVLRLFGDRTDFLEARVSVEEVRRMVDDAREHGTIDPGVGSIAARALELSDLRAAHVMVHRRHVRGVPLDADEAEVRRLFLEAKHRRLPIYDGSIENVVGYLSWRDVVERVCNGEPLSARELQRPVIRVPETAPAAALLRTMQDERQHLVVVLDEHGGLAGIVTLEDLIEELVGEIESEHGAEPQRFVRQSDGTIQVLGELPLRDADRELGTELERESDAHTVGGLVVQLAGDRIPRSGETFQAADGTTLAILEASPRRVRRVALRPKPAPEDGAPGGG